MSDRVWTEVDDALHQHRQMPEAGSPEWHSLHHTGEGQHHECDWDVCVEWSARRAPRPEVTR